jgi:8-oxo-dGTP pyrophosphatase MutT (NUDIX family)
MEDDSIVVEFWKNVNSLAPPAQGGPTDRILPCFQGSAALITNVSILVRDRLGRSLLQMRDSNARNSPLAWGFWGGAVEREDTDHWHTALRELEEELDIVAHTADFIEIGRRTGSDGQEAPLLLLLRPVEWGEFRVLEGAGAGYFQLDEIRQLPITRSVAWYLANKPDVFTSA